MGTLFVWARTSAVISKARHWFRRTKRSVSVCVCLSLLCALCLFLVSTKIVWHSGNVHSTCSTACSVSYAHLMFSQSRQFHAAVTNRTINACKRRQFGAGR